MQKVLLFEEDILNLQIKVAVTQECALERNLFLKKILRSVGLACANELVLKQLLASGESNLTRKSLSHGSTHRH